jgi:hypothetical protein
VKRTTFVNECYSWVIKFINYIAKFIWICFKEALGWDKSPGSLQGLNEGWVPLGCFDYELKIFLLGVVLWTLWNTRNKFTIGCAQENQLS